MKAVVEVIGISRSRSKEATGGGSLPCYICPPITSPVESVRAANVAERKANLKDKT